MLSSLRIPHPHDVTPLENLTTLIENRSVFTLNQCELNVFETHQESQNVRLQFSDLTFTSMLRGKKRMKILGGDKFDYVPGESVIVPHHEEMIIDFPEATLNNPTQCIALVIDQNKVQETIDVLNETHPKAEHADRWALRHEEYHLTNSTSLVHTVNRLVAITQEQLRAKDILADYALRELLIRLMQTQARSVILNNHVHHANTHRFAAVVQYIHDHITENLTVERLSKVAYMSQSHFFRSFKMEFGIAPVEFVLAERVRIAKEMLANPIISIADVAFRTGFNSIHYFSAQFKKHTGMTASAYRFHISTPMVTRMR